MKTRRVAHDTKSQAVAHELSRAVGAEVSVTLTKNRERIVSVRKSGERFIVRVHHALAAEGGEVRQALTRFIAGSCRKSARLLRDHFAQLESARTASRLPRRVRIDPVGEVYRLDAILAEVARHFPDVGMPAITWGPRRRPGRYRVRLGSYCPSDKVVRVNPMLDHPSVPVAVVRHVVFHELIHHVLTATGDGAHHGPSFRVLERRSPDLAPAEAWQKRGFHARLRQARAVTN